MKKAADKRERKRGKDEFNAMVPFQAWKEAGKKRDDDGGPVGMRESDVVLIAKVLLKKITPDRALKEVGTGTKARAWFKELRAEDGKLWDKEMEKVLAETAKMGAELRMKSKPLF